MDIFLSKPILSLCRCVYRVTFQTTALGQTISSVCIRADYASFIDTQSREPTTDLGSTLVKPQGKFAFVIGENTGPMFSYKLRVREASYRIFLEGYKGQIFLQTELKITKEENHWRSFFAQQKIELAFFLETL